MTTAHWLLPCFVLVELAALGGTVAWRRSLPTAPVLELERFDSLTAADLENLRSRVGTDPARWRELGEACMAYGYFPEAEACFIRSDELQPENFETIYAWAYTLQRLGRLEESLERFREAGRLSPPQMLTACRHNLGRTLLRMEEVERAEGYFRYDPNFLPSSYQLAKILARTNRQDEAIALIDSTLDQIPDLMQPLQLRARIAEEQGNPHMAAHYWERAERSDDKIPLADHHLYLNPIRFRYGAARKISELVMERDERDKTAAAAGMHELLQQLDFWDARKMVPTLAELELELGRPEVAEQLLRDHFKTSSIMPETLRMLGDAQRGQGQQAEALDTYLRALKLRPNDQIHGRLKQVFEESGEAAQAQSHAAHELMHRGMNAYRRGELRSALNALEAAVELDPEEAQAWFSLAETLRAGGAFEQAEQAYARCLEIAPNHRRAQIGQNRLSRFRR